MILETAYCSIRLVDLNDADFIVDLRKRSEQQGFVSKSQLDTEAQKAWIASYKEKESTGKEYYFITEANGKKYGVMRLYNIESNSFTSGSWIFLDGSPNQISITTNILIRKFGFEYLNKEINYYDVRKANKQVIEYNNLFGPEYVREDELSNYYLCRRTVFMNKAKRLSRLCGVDFGKDINSYIQF